MNGSWILSGILALPLIGALFILLLPGDSEATKRNARWIALFATLITFVLSLVAWGRFDPAQPGFQLVEERDWFSHAILYKLGVDGVSMPFVLLTTFIMPICIVASWTPIQTRVKEYMITFLVMETLMVGVFVALDLVLFYLFFEGGLIPMFIIIGIWGHGNRVYAAFKFFLYTFTGSVLMLLAIMAMYWTAGTTDITVLLKTPFPAHMQTWLWLGFFASFAVKMPMWPVHTWLPDAHVEAPTAGSVVLAAILLKMGGYGFIRFSLSMFPDASVYFTPLVFALSVIAIIYTSLVALAQESTKKLIAYSSVAHMGFVTMGIFAANTQGIQGAVYQMISHGLVSGALFLCVGVLYDRMHTYDIAAYGGLVQRMPLYARRLHGVHIRQYRIAGHHGLHRRILDPDRHVPDQQLGRVPRHHRHNPVGVLRALPLPPHHLWRYREAEPDGHRRPHEPRGRDACCRLACSRSFTACTHSRSSTPAQLQSNRSSAASSTPSRRRSRRGSDDVRGSAPRADCLLERATLMHETAISLPVILPEVVLAAGTLALVLYGALRGERGSALVNEIAVGLLGLVFILMVAKNRPMGVTFYGSFADDAFTRFMSALALVGSLVTLLLSVEFMRQERIGGFEFPVLILISTLGMLMLISANDFIALYLGLELMSLALYVIAAYRRHDLRATEAGLKYFVLGALVVRHDALRRCRSSTGIPARSPSARSRTPCMIMLTSACCSDWCSFWWGWRSRSPSCRFTCGRPTSTKARRPR